MYEWLLVAIGAYLFFGLSSFGDKLVLSGTNHRLPRSISYTFYTGILGLLTILFIPFIEFGFPSGQGLMWIILDALVRILGIYTMFIALERFEVSKVAPTIGALQPIFVFILTWVFLGSQIMTQMDILAFAILFAASIVISFEKDIKLTRGYLGLTAFSSLMFSLDYVFAKLVFENEPFMQGVIWLCIFNFLFVLIFLFSKKSRKEIFSKEIVTDKKTQITFIGTQAFGGVANFLQAYAISLTLPVFLPIVNSLKGIQYVFLFIITMIVSFFFPKVMKEDLSKKVIIKKIISIILIVIGLVILVIY